MGLFPVKEKIHFILLSSGDGLKKGTWLLGCSTHWQWCSTGEVLKTPFTFFFQRVSNCVYTHRYTANEQVQGRKDSGNSFIYLHRHYDSNLHSKWVPRHLCNMHCMDNNCFNCVRQKRVADFYFWERKSNLWVNFLRKDPNIFNLLSCIISLYTNYLIKQNQI